MQRQGKVTSYSRKDKFGFIRDADSGSTDIPFFAIVCDREPTKGSHVLFDLSESNIALNIKVL
jgi:hypothetical protein